MIIDSLGAGRICVESLSGWDAMFITGAEDHQERKDNDSAPGATAVT